MKIVFTYFDLFIIMRKKGNYDSQGKHYGTIQVLRQQRGG